MYTDLKEQLAGELDELRTAGLFKAERHIDSAQSASILAGSLGQDARKVLNFCANNYLGLADDPRIIEAAKQAMDERGFGMASVRFICGTQDLHLELESAVSKFLGTEDTILFSSCFDANGGVFESLFGPQDAIISDALNHASIIDGIRLSKAARFRYANQDMADLEVQLKAAAAMNDGAGARRTIIVTDGIFSMDGYIAPLEAICDLAEQYNALVMVDDSHAVGFMGATGAGTPEHAGVSDRVDIYTGTFGKALGGASGGYVSGRGEIVAMLRQKARPYLFSNSLAPAIVAATLKALELVEGSGELREKLFENAALFRTRMSEEGFDLLDGEHAIVPVMFGDAVKAAEVAGKMLEHGVYVTAFSFPVVPKGAARIRVQLSAAHSAEDIEACVQAFVASR
ncbi:glycine C-acetyltransferase [Glutamicibacter protophormiae]|uniref:2-amino-3-ketobutyrate coenzyme A ligase n=1 Tax=Glutamicibacter protophormiae TaxID=37930 RepID=A0ABS4XR45_GLUPR|nr:glycine C-acetyltransferase [Glutamicibacter protophormiae]MBP2398810.1 glycine C-acetyltransferase [Glutamicibacter protophormiae]QRQ79512.1 glycine C-acetyltransferase [Glutamicibacter protophormiae]GGL82679.1 2-amino-3-ketobutyrate coenzyme A ligase [Glutamicibacter protophormiae]